MNSQGVVSPGAGLTLLNPETIVGDLGDAKTAALKTLQQSFKILGQFSTTKTSSTAQGTGLPDLESPTLSQHVNDLTLRIGLLQDALNQLMQQVSKSEIQQRLGEMQKENQRQLDKFRDQMDKAAEAAEKNKEAKKKGNVFEAISNWIQAVVSIVSAVITLVTAVGEIFTNPVGAAGLIVAGVALLGAAAVQVTLAIDATMRAAGQEGFLSEADKTKMQKAVEILGYIALAGSMIGLIGGVVVALGQAGKAAGTLAGREVGRLGAAKLAASGMKEMAKNSAKIALGRTASLDFNMGINRVAAYAFKDAMANLMKLGAQLAVTQAVGTAANKTAIGVGKDKVADLQQQASDLQAESDQAQAAAKAIAAQVAKLHALIEQLQQELSNMMDQAQQTLAIIFGAINETMDSTSRIQETRSV